MGEDGKEGRYGDEGDGEKRMRMGSRRRKRTRRKGER